MAQQLLTKLALVLSRAVETGCVDVADDAVVYATVVGLEVKNTRTACCLVSAGTIICVHVSANITTIADPAFWVATCGLVQQSVELSLLTL